MKEINEEELNCLKKIANGRLGVTSPCSEHTLKTLLAMGLIEEGPRIWLPLEMKQIDYHVTAAGKLYLRNR